MSKVIRCRPASGVFGRGRAVLAIVGQVVDVQVELVRAAGHWQR